jgi:adenylate kinase
VVVIEVADETDRRAHERAAHRSGDGRGLPRRAQPAAADIADRVVQRPDDREETVRHRLAVYARDAPLVEHYERAGVPVHRVDGDRPIDEVQAEILARLGR